MKPRNLIYACTAILMIAIASCKKDDLLNQTPPTALSDASYWHTPSDLQNYLNNLYGQDRIFPHYRNYGSLGIYSVDDNSDNMVPQSVSSRLSGQNTVASNSYTDWSITGVWSSIRDVNYFLANYGRVSAAAADVAPYVGEAYFFRAMLYFNILRNVGGAPWVTQPLNINATALLNAPRLARNILVDSINNDLDRAIAKLPTKTKAQTQRLYKEYAEGYKARVCLYEGTWEKYHAQDVFGVSGQDGSKYLQLAASTANTVISSGVFSLDNVAVPNGYFNLFNQTDYSGSKEVMFWGAYNQTDGIVTYWQNYYHGGSSGTNSDGLSRSLVNDYLCTDGQPVSVSPLYKGDDSLKHVLANRDPRLAQSIFIYGDTVVTNQPSGIDMLFQYPALNTGGPCTTGYQLRKGLNTDFYQDSHNSPGGTDGVIYMRYAEVLLIYAEARAELGLITQGDIDMTINALRDRVHMAHLNMATIAHDPNWLYPELSPIINEVRRERRVELACEGYRLDDIMRWAAANDVVVGKQPLGAQVTQFLTVPLVAGPLKVGSNIFVNAQGYIIPYAQNSAMSSGYKFNAGRDYLLPIPLQETVVNPAIKQNPGW